MGYDAAALRHAAIAGTLALLVMLLVPGSVLATGWQPEQTIAYFNYGTDSNISCARAPYTNTNLCVYWSYNNSSTGVDLYYVRSFDGGVSWSGASTVGPTVDAGSEYDPFLLADPSRNRVWLIYSRNRWGFVGNDLMITYTWDGGSSWASPTAIIADGKNHWDSGLAVLANGDILALETFEGFEGTEPGRIRSIRSTDGGVTWGAPQVMWHGENEEWYPKGFQDANGTLWVGFKRRKVNGDLSVDIIKSGDSGYSFPEHYVMQDNPNVSESFTFIGTQWSGHNVTLLFTSDYAYMMQSSDGGWTFDGPYPVSDTPWVFDAEFSMGCRGFIMTYTTSGRHIAKRYDGTDYCQ
jgi:hypothetical protein